MFHILQTRKIDVFLVVNYRLYKRIAYALPTYRPCYP